MTQQGKISISRPHGTGCDYIEIQVVDGASCVPFLDVKIKYAEFAKALTGLGDTDCEFVTRGLDLIGKTREHCHISVEIPRCESADERERAIRDAISDHEVDGWMGNDDDVKNHHHFIGKGPGGVGRWNVTFVRYVDPEVAQ